MVIALLKVERFKEAVIAAKESVKQCPGQSRTFLLIAHATSRYPEENGKLRERAKVDTTLGGIAKVDTRWGRECQSTDGMYRVWGNVWQLLGRIRPNLIDTEI